ncbi:MAG: rhomboid family intramembrane serine protease [Pirellulaceae bacterium]
MRQLTSLTNEEHARRLTAYLITEGIEAHTEQDDAGWLIWVREEDDLPAALEIFEQFQADPEHTRYREAVQTATTLQQEDAKRQQERQEQVKRQHVQMRGQWRQGRGKRHNPLTKMLIALSVLVSLLAGTLLNARAPKNGWSRHLQFADAALVQRERQAILDENGMVTAQDEQRLALISLQTNPWELWRLVTPIFLHMGIMHLVFNMLWLHDLGSSLEARYGTPRYAGLVVTIAILSVLAQSLAPTTWEAFSGTWNHGGMSGVVYGLLGFIWVRMRMDPSARLFLHPTTIMFMIGWLFFCVFLTQAGTMPIANLAHAAGLLAGMGISRMTLPNKSGV